MRAGTQDPSSTPPLPTSTSLPPMTLTPRTPSHRREVEAILEGDESLSRSRTQSLAQHLVDDPKVPPVPAVPVPAPSTFGRSRSHTESSSSRPSIGAKPSSSNGQSLLRKASFTGASRDREKSSPDSTPPDEPSRMRKVSEASKLTNMPPTPTRRRGPARRRESMDLDDIINDPVPTRRGGGSPALMPKPAHQTANTRDLIDFLSEGPPEPYQPPRSASSGAIDPGSTKPAKQSGGRWFRRLVGGSSSGSERPPAVPDVPEAVRTLGKQKSAHNIRGSSSGFGLSQAYAKVPPSPALSLDTALQPQSSFSLVRKVSPNRKAVPAWSPDGGVSVSGPEPQSPPLSAPTRSPEPAPPAKTLSPQRAEFDVFDASRPRQPERAPSVSPSLSKSSSLRRVPVPRMYPGPASDAHEHGTMLASTPETVVTLPEVKPERRRPERVQEPRAEKAQEPRPENVVPTSEDKSRPIRKASLAPPAVFTSNQAAELRAALVHATTADECRVLLDVVLGQWGLGRPAPEASAVPPLSAGCSDFDDSDEAMAVEMLLGEGSMRPERQWPLTPKDSHSKLHEARLTSLHSSE